MKKFLALSFALFFCCGTAFAASRNPDTITTPLPVKDVKTLRDAIIKGCDERGWVPSKSADNEITAVLDVRGHSVTVRIPYGIKGFEIIYKDSKNMNYNEKKNTIHPKYNQWTGNLNKSIKSSLDFKKEME